MFAVQPQNSEDGMGFCATVLTALSWLVVALTFPVSVFMCFKVTFGRLFLGKYYVAHRLSKNTNAPSSFVWDVWCPVERVDQVGLFF
jgi:hypothetical protein